MGRASNTSRDRDAAPEPQAEARRQSLGRVSGKRATRGQEGTCQGMDNRSNGKDKGVGMFARGGMQKQAWMCARCGRGLGVTRSQESGT
jgi:hypothetical protein